MQDPTTLFSLEPAGRDLLAGGFDGATALRGLGMLAVFGGHMDAGHLSEQVRDTVFDSLDHKLLASFDADQLIDYRSRRPQITFDGERFRDYQTPRLQLHLVSDALGRPFLLLSGPEPDYQWERFVSSVLFLVEKLDVKLVALVDAVPMPVPHTRPLGVTAHGNRDELVAGLSTWSPQARMVSGVGQLLELRLDEHHRGTTGYTLHVPHYLNDAAYPQAAVAALEYVGAALGLMLPTEKLRERGREVDRELDRQTGSSREVTAMVEGLEKNFDQNSPGAGRSLLVGPDEQVPDAEELGAAVEEYLQSQPRHALDAGGGVQPEEHWAAAVGDAEVDSEGPAGPTAPEGTEGDPAEGPDSRPQD
ncbi:PAC2 family protein [Citricoccus muralis]|uniref:Putative ATP-grasp superfamily ATP-dependent carboligase n=1 Tax=Citricoccus muralis TaxID=169134 RepID=A0A3D9LAM5_9MICC|nr:PAC2 family protein [Citricoccus muralis]REE03325.1 putative ATP-grasp superfamily ATP-dependent carboligase [Citricoccus muralis]